jgi:hypothetical protein
VFEHVLTPTEDGSFSSTVLSSWSRDPANRALALELRDGLTFSDGSSVTISDLRASVEAAGLQATPRGSRSLLVATADSSIPVECTLLRTALFRRTGDIVLGTRAYRVSRSSASELVLDRVHRASHRVGQVTFRRYETPRRALAAGLAGHANAVLSPPAGAEELAKGTSLRLVEGRPVQAVVMLLNPRTIDAATRRALLAVPTDRIAAAAERRPAPVVLASWPIPTDGPRLRILVSHVDLPDLSLERAGVAFRRAVEESGRSVLLERGDVTVILKRIRQGDFDLALAPLLVWPPAAAAAVWATDAPDNLTHYSNLELDQALAAGNFAAAVEALRSDPPVLELSPRPRRVLLDARITNARLGPYGLLQSLPDWYVD